MNNQATSRHLMDPAVTKMKGTRLGLVMATKMAPNTRQVITVKQLILVTV